MAQTLYSYSLKISEMVGAEYAEEFIQDEKRKNFKILNNQNISQAVLISESKGDEEEIKNVYYRPKEKRYIGSKMIKGHRIQVYGKTKKECYKKLKNEIEKINQLIKTGLKSSKGNPTLKEYWEKWYKESKKPANLAEKTLKDIKRVFEILKPLHNLKLKNIGKEQITKLLNSINVNRDKRMAQIYFKAVIKSAFEDGLIKSNPFNNLMLQKFEMKSKQAFTLKEQQLIMQNLKYLDIGPIIIVYLITGIRLSELNIINIENDIHIESKIFRALNLKQRKENAFKVQKVSAEFIDFVLTNKDKLKEFQHTTISRKFTKFLNGLDIQGSIVTCRHTSATNRFVLGQKEFEIARELGHSTSGVTKDFYIDIDYSLSKQKLRELYGNLYREF